LKPLSDKSILIIGLGLIGGSIARGLKQANAKQRVLATDLDNSALSEAIQDGAIDAGGDLDDLCPEADIVIVALPPLAISSTLPKISAILKHDAIVTDVGSVKKHIVTTANELGSDFAERFVPGHPIAGSEQSGYSASRADLFEQRNVILTPQIDTRTEALAAINDLWRTLGANVLGMSLVKHDEVLAATSHLPHLLAFAIVDVLVKQEQSEDIFRYAAGGFADFSRLASSDAKMWSDIFVANADATERVLDAYIQNLLVFKNVVHDKDHA